MCRLYGFISNEPTKVDCSLVFAQNALMQQSRVDESGVEHTDGWGIAAYQNGLPEVYKKTTAAFDDQLFSGTAERIYSTAIVAHIRKATVGKNSIFNTHPFVSGRWTFAHNGTVSGFDQIQGQLEQETAPDLQSHRQGQTDSEQYFLWLLSQIPDRDKRECRQSDWETTLVSLRESVARLDDRCRTVAPDETPSLNFVLTDGKILLACRWNRSLYLVRRTGIYECEICGIPHIHHLETVDHRAVVIASEPVTHEDWVELPNQEVFWFGV